MALVVIHVKGGVVQSVQTDDGDVQIILCDKDNEEQGDPEAVWFPANLVESRDPETDRLRKIADSNDYPRLPVCPECGETVNVVHLANVKEGRLHLSCVCGLAMSIAAIGGGAQ